MVGEYFAALTLLGPILTRDEPDCCTSGFPVFQTSERSAYLSRSLHGSLAHDNAVYTARRTRDHPTTITRGVMVQSSPFPSHLSSVGEQLFRRAMD